MRLPCLKNARRIFAIVSTTSIPTSASKNHGSQCGPSVPGSRLEADHPEKGVLFACRFTRRGLLPPPTLRERPPPSPWRVNERCPARLALDAGDGAGAIDAA